MPNVASPKNASRNFITKVDHSTWLKMIPIIWWRDMALLNVTFEWWKSALAKKMSSENLISWKKADSYFCRKKWQTHQFIIRGWRHKVRWCCSSSGFYRRWGMHLLESLFWKIRSVSKIMQKQANVSLFFSLAICNLILITLLYSTTFTFL